LGLFDLFKRSKIHTMSEFSTCANATDGLAMLPGLIEHIMDVVLRASIQFYRDIHSHEAGPFPRVKDEFFYLVFFIAEQRIQSLFPAEASISALNDAASSRLSAIDRSFSRDEFWDAYLVRKKAYSAPHLQVDDLQMKAANTLPYIFSGFLQRHLDCPEAIVRHHALQMAGEAILMLEGCK